MAVGIQFLVRTDALQSVVKPGFLIMVADDNPIGKPLLGHSGQARQIAFHSLTQSLVPTQAATEGAFEFIIQQADWRIAGPINRKAKNRNAAVRAACDAHAGRIVIHLFDIHNAELE